MIATEYNDGQIIIEGSLDDLVDFARCLRYSHTNSSLSLLMPKAEVGTALTEIRIIPFATGLIEICSKNQMLEIRGSIENLGKLANSVESVTKGNISPVGRLRPHAHVEYYPDHAFLSKDCAAVVITLAQ